MLNSLHQVAATISFVVGCIQGTEANSPSTAMAVRVGYAGPRNTQRSGAFVDLLSNRFGSVKQYSVDQIDDPVLISEVTRDCDVVVIDRDPSEPPLQMLRLVERGFHVPAIVTGAVVDRILRTKFGKL